MTSVLRRKKNGFRTPFPLSSAVTMEGQMYSNDGRQAYSDHGLWWAFLSAAAGALVASFIAP